MAIIKQAQLFFAKLDPKRPSKKFSKENPRWELQIRTTNKEVKKLWESMDLKPKLVEDEESGGVYYRVNLSKKAFKKDGEANDPVEVVNGNLDKIDPSSIGNGSIGNIRVYQYEYNNEGKKGIASTLMKVQVTKHVVYVPKGNPDDEFDMTDTETIIPDDEDEEDTPPKKSAPKTPKSPKASDDPLY
jgi:hypothetical protein